MKRYIKLSQVLTLSICSSVLFRSSLALNVVMATEQSIESEAYIIEEELVVEEIDITNTLDESNDVEQDINEIQPDVYVDSVENSSKVLGSVHSIGSNPSNGSTNVSTNLEGIEFYYDRYIPGLSIFGVADCTLTWYEPNGEEHTKYVHKDNMSTGYSSLYYNLSDAGVTLLPGVTYEVVSYYDTGTEEVMDEPIFWGDTTFTTAGENPYLTEPEVTSMSPNLNGTEILLSDIMGGTYPQVVVNFDEAIYSNSLETADIHFTDNSTGSVWQLDYDGQSATTIQNSDYKLTSPTQITIDLWMRSQPENFFTAGHNYTLTIKGLESMSYGGYHNSMEPVNYNFTIREDGTGYVETPDFGSGMVDPNIGDIVIKFDQPMDTTETLGVRIVQLPNGENNTIIYDGYWVDEQTYLIPWNQTLIANYPNTGPDANGQYTCYRFSIYNAYTATGEPVYINYNFGTTD